MKESGITATLAPSTSITKDTDKTCGRRVGIPTASTLDAEIPLITPHYGIDELVASGRWVEVQIPLGTGNHYCTLACYYGYAGKTASERVMNERMLSHATSRATADPDTPYLLFTDGNVQYDKSKVISTMVISGLLIDLHSDYNDLEVRAPTFNMHGITDP